jgi:hypothetical protein
MDHAADQQPSDRRGAGLIAGCGYLTDDGHIRWPIRDSRPDNR